MNCEECEETQATVLCCDCEQSLCFSCDQKLHRKGKRQTHQRHPLCAQCSAAALLLCAGCKAAVCGACKASHEGHVLAQMTSSKRAAVFWDVATARAEDAEEVERVLNQLHALYGSSVSIRAYGEAAKTVTDALAQMGVIRVVKAGLKEGETMLLDLTTTPRDVTDVLVISGQATSNRHFYAELADSLAGIALLISTTCLPLTPVPPQALGVEVKRTPTRNISTEIPAGQTVILEGVPLYQRFYRKQGHEEVHDRLMALMRTSATEGVLMVELNSLISSLQRATMLTADQANTIIKAAEGLGLIHLVQRQFAVSRNNLTLCCMRLDSLSLEALTWVLRSLKRDEMMPTERAIQSRIKEAFDFKPSQVQWSNLLDAARGRSMEGHHHSSSAPNEQEPGSLFGLSFQDDPLRPIPVFTVEDINDPLTGQETCVIYPKDEVWIAFDQHKDADVLGVKQSEEWRVFKQFLENYFVGDKMGKKRVWKRQEEVKSIPGGRYGCAQFLKTCGPPQLQQCSLGRLSYMVQVAINDDLLRYQRTLLVWTSTSQKRSDDEEAATRLQAAQHAIWKVLSESKAGVSLAQLPQHVKKHTSIDLNDLGFAKLKDLLATMPEVHIELHGTNHPFAVLKPECTFDKELEDVLSCISHISRESPNGVPLQALERMAVSRLGRTVEWKKLGCGSLMEFVRKWGKSLFFIVRTADDSLLLKSTAEQKPSSFSRDTVPPPGPHSHSFSVTLSSNHFHQHSGSTFYSLNPLEKVVKTSDLPEEFLGSHSNTLSGVSEHEDGTGLPMSSEEDTSISTALHGFDPPHYRTESVEYHSNNPSIGRHDWKRIGQAQTLEPIFHVKTSSEDMEPGWQGHNRETGSYTPVFHINPPPGFS